jgi:hypothetical protein
MGRFLRERLVSESAGMSPSFSALILEPYLKEAEGVATVARFLGESGDSLLLQAVITSIMARLKRDDFNNFIA